MFAENLISNLWQPRSLALFQIENWKYEADNQVEDYQTCEDEDECFDSFDTQSTHADDSADHMHLREDKCYRFRKLNQHLFRNI